jgi:hypothetical protein
MTKPWEKPSPGRRAAGTRERRRMLIVCEDSKSSRDYFDSFGVDPKRAEVVTLGMGMNTDSLVEQATLRKDKAARSGKPCNQVWCVFDRDSFPLENYVRAFQRARDEGIKVAWSNEAFEIWYLLHFNYHNTGISRDNYEEKLGKSGLVYSKTDKSIYAKLKPLQNTALRNARKLERYWNQCGEMLPERQNPSTNVHRLVEFLNELSDLGGTD